MRWRGRLEALLHLTRRPNRRPEFKSDKHSAVFCGKQNWPSFSQEFKPSPCVIVATSTHILKPDHDAFLTLTKWVFLRLNVRRALAQHCEERNKKIDSKIEPKYSSFTLLNDHTEKGETSRSVTFLLDWSLQLWCWILICPILNVDRLNVQLSSVNALDCRPVSTLAASVYVSPVSSCDGFSSVDSCEQLCPWTSLACGETAVGIHNTLTNSTFCPEESQPCEILV